MLELIQRVAQLPPALFYTILGVGAATENVIPPVPADTFVLLGAFLAAHGDADPWLVFFCTWLPNIGSALAVYGVAHRHGRRVFETHYLARWLLREKQLRQMRAFYARWGVPAIFVSRFLPAFRALVPVFAGVSHMSFWRVGIPIATASALWYGALVWVGVAAGRNLQKILDLVDQVSGVLLWVALAALAVVAVWWWRSRRHET